MSIRYRTGVDARTGRRLTGAAHLAQSVDKIVTTMLTERVMRLDFGLHPTRRLGRNISPELAAQLYRDVVVAVHKWEPEYRVSRLTLVDIDRGGGLQLRVEGRYFPEGRFGNYLLEEPANFSLALVALAKRGAA